MLIMAQADARPRTMRESQICILAEGGELE
jgi:hypothetical protein